MMASKQALTLYTLSILSTICRAQTSTSLSIISHAPSIVQSTVSSQVTPNGPSSSFDSLGTGTSTPTTTIFGLTEPTYPPTLTSCFIPATGSISSRVTLDPSASTQPAGAECIEIIRTSGHVIEVELFTVAQDGSTILPTGEATPSATSTSSSSSSTGTGAIVGAVIGSVFGTVLIGATLFWIRKQRRSSKPVANWLNRPAGWVRDEKQQANVIEMSRRDGV